MHYMAHIAHVVTGVWSGEVGIYNAFVCAVLFLADRINLSAGAIIDHNQSAKDIDPYFTSPLCEGPRPPKAGTHLTEWAE